MITTLARIGTLKTRITVVVIVLVLVAAALAAYVSLQLGERHMRTVLGDQQYALLSSAAAYIDEDLRSKQALLMNMSEQLMLGDYRAPMAVQHFLEAHGGLREEFFNLVVLDARGALIANLHDRRVIGTANFSQRDYFLDTVKSHESVISAPFRSTLSKQPVVVVTEPVFGPAGELRYMLVGAIDLQRPRFFGQLEVLKPGKTGYIFMLTKNGTIIHHPDKSRILMNVKQEEGGPVPSTLAAINGFEGWVEARSKRGVKSLITYKGLSRTDWIIGAVYPVDEAFAPLINMRKTALLGSAAVAIVVGLLGWLSILRLLSPLNALRRHVASMSADGSDIGVFDVERKDEFGELSRAFFVLSQERHEAEKKLLALTRTDALTGLNNRRMFEEIMLAALARARRSQRQIAVAYLDIDHFKQVNDTHGHGIGDKVLIEFAHRLLLAVRTTDTVARLAGDEFVIIFENLADDIEISVLAAKIISSVEPEFNIDGLSLSITTSIGIAVNVNGGATSKELLEAADKALYEAKHGGRNRYAVSMAGAAFAPSG